MKRDLNLAIRLATRYLNTWGKLFLDLKVAEKLEDLGDYPTFGRWIRARQRIKRQVDETQQPKADSPKDDCHGAIFGMVIDSEVKTVKDPDGIEFTYTDEKVSWLNKPERPDKGRLPLDSRYLTTVSESSIANQCKADSRRSAE